MANLKNDLLAAAGDEPIEAIVIGRTGWASDDGNLANDYGGDQIPRYLDQPHGKVLRWVDAADWLDYDFNDGYGAPECNAITAWTASRIFFISKYDGSTSLDWVHRHPVEHQPDMPGGG